MVGEGAAQFCDGAEGENDFVFYHLSWGEREGAYGGEIRAVGRSAGALHSVKCQLGSARKEDSQTRVLPVDPRRPWFGDAGVFVWKSGLSAGQWGVLPSWLIGGAIDQRV